jgi:hypothetical protein
MPKLIGDGSFNPKKIYNDLIKRCKSVRRWEIRCIVDESWVGVAPFDMMIEDGIFKIEFVNSEENDADIFTKNTTEEIFQKQSNKIVEKVNNHK